MQIRDWPDNERPREKLLKQGPGVLSDAELLAIFLCSGVQGSDVVTSARRLLSSHGPLRSLLENTPKQLLKLPGIGPARAVFQDRKDDSDGVVRAVRQDRHPVAST